MKLQDYIQYYIGRRVLVDEKEYGTLMGGTFIPNSINQIYYMIRTDEMVANEDEDFDMPYNDDADEPARIKPMLRRLEDITEEEQVFICHLHMPAGWKGVRLLENSEDDWGMRILYDQETFKSLYVRKDRLTPKAFNYLLKQGFDLFGLIDAGLAVDIKTLK